MREWEPNLQAVNQEDQNSQDQGQGQGMRKMLLCWVMLILKNPFIRIILHGLLSFMLHGVDIVKD